jgi:hypothetical protein
MINASRRTRDSSQKAAQFARRAGAWRFRHAAGVTVAVTAAILASTPSAAAARLPPRPEQPSRTSVVVERVEVPVPVDDMAAEVVQMQLAAAAAAIIATAVTKARLRRRHHHCAVNAVIDITDPGILDGAASANRGMNQATSGMPASAAASETASWLEPLVGISPPPLSPGGTPQAAPCLIGHQRCRISTR